MKIDLREYREPDEFILTLGGKLDSVPARELATVLSSFAETYELLARETSLEDYELHIVAFDQGSFKTVFRKVVGFEQGLFRDIVVSVTASILTAYIMNLLSEPGFVRSEFDDHIVFSRGSEVYLVPSEAVKKAESLRSEETLGKSVSRVFSRLTRIEGIEFLSLEVRDDEQPTPIFRIPRTDFARIEQRALEVEDKRETRTIVEERQRIQLVKAVFEDSKRKWDFVHHGRKVSCVIADKDFYDDTKSRKYLFGRGDELLADLTVLQKRDDESGAWINAEVEVTKVHDLIPGTEN